MAVKYYLQWFRKPASGGRGGWMGVEMFEYPNDLLALEYMASYMDSDRALRNKPHRIVDDKGKVVCTYNPVILPNVR